MSSQLSLSSLQQCTLSVVFADPTGKPAQVNGNPSWSINDDTVAQLVPATKADGTPDPFSMIFWPLDGAAGDVEVTCTADADVHGGGPEPVDATFDLSVTAPEASTATITASTPVVKQPLLPTASQTTGNSPPTATSSGAASGSTNAGASASSAGTTSP